MRPNQRFGLCAWTRTPAHTNTLVVCGVCVCVCVCCSFRCVCVGRTLPHCWMHWCDEHVLGKHQHQAHTSRCTERTQHIYSMYRKSYDDAACDADDNMLACLFLQSLSRDSNLREDDVDISSCEIWYLKPSLDFYINICEYKYHQMFDIFIILKTCFFIK